jgi:HD-GYP domain-containing protein (c-di-GMP phosphodiesterase class II)
VLHHHERIDGAGYPGGLSGDAIPLESRIIAVADAFEAMVGVRPYHEGIEIEAALAELARHAGTQFDAACVDALVGVATSGRALAA